VLGLLVTYPFLLWDGRRILDERSFLFPYYTEADYGASRSLTLLEIWRNARMGWTLDVYEVPSRASSPPPTGGLSSSAGRMALPLWAYSEGMGIRR
jgi:hypothetical protein